MNLQIINGCAGTDPGLPNQLIAIFNFMCNLPCLNQLLYMIVVFKMRNIQQLLHLRPLLHLRRLLHDALILVKKNQFCESIHDFRLLGKTNPILAFTFTTILFSMAGIPPLAGFCSKFYLFFASLSSSLYVLAFVGIVTSVISCFYYIRFVRIMYFETPNTSATKTNQSHVFFSDISFANSLVLALVGIFLILFFVYPSPLFLWTHKIAIALCF